MPNRIHNFFKTLKSRTKGNIMFENANLASSNLDRFIIEIYNDELSPE